MHHVRMAKIVICVDRCCINKSKRGGEEREMERRGEEKRDYHCNGRYINKRKDPVRRCMLV